MVDACIAAISSRREPISALGLYFIGAATSAGAIAQDELLIPLGVSGRCQAEIIRVTIGSLWLKSRA
jgi:hypothetical protein